MGVFMYSRIISSVIMRPLVGKSYFPAPFKPILLCTPHSLPIVFGIDMSDSLSRIEKQIQDLLATLVKTPQRRIVN